MAIIYGLRRYVNAIVSDVYKVSAVSHARIVPFGSCGLDQNSQNRNTRKTWLAFYSEQRQEKYLFGMDIANLAGDLFFFKG